MLAVGATRGKNLFEGLNLTLKYFFDAVGAQFVGSLAYRQIENKGDMQRHPTVLADVRQAAENLLKPLIGRRVILFAGKTGAARSQMAAAFCQYLAGERYEALCAGTEPSAKVHPFTVEVMQEKGIDMAFRTPCALAAVLSEQAPDLIVSMDEGCCSVPDSGLEHQSWSLADPSGRTLSDFRRLRDEIERKIIMLIKNQP